jgi:hypothetical protein
MHTHTHTQKPILVNGASPHASGDVQSLGLSSALWPPCPTAILMTPTPSLSLSHTLSLSLSLSVSLSLSLSVCLWVGADTTEDARGWPYCAAAAGPVGRLVEPVPARVHLPGHGAGLCAAQRGRPLLVRGAQCVCVCVYVYVCVCVCMCMCVCVCVLYLSLSLSLCVCVCCV